MNCPWCSMRHRKFPLHCFLAGRKELSILLFGLSPGMRIPDDAMPIYMAYGSFVWYASGNWREEYIDKITEYGIFSPQMNIGENR